MSPGPPNTSLSSGPVYRITSPDRRVRPRVQSWGRAGNVHWWWWAGARGVLAPASLPVPSDSCGPQLSEKVDPVCWFLLHTRFGCLQEEAQQRPSTQRLPGMDSPAGLQGDHSSSQWPSWQVAIGLSLALAAPTGRSRKWGAGSPWLPSGR